jgi:hypothetical protein
MITLSSYSLGSSYSLALPTLPLACPTTHEMSKLVEVQVMNACMAGLMQNGDGQRTRDMEKTVRRVGHVLEHIRNAQYSPKADTDLSGHEPIKQDLLDMMYQLDHIQSNISSIRTSCDDDYLHLNLRY